MRAFTVPYQAGQLLLCVNDIKMIAVWPFETGLGSLIDKLQKAALLSYEIQVSRNGNL